jgi:uncharacterized membrane protein YccF (DUF307 family)
VTLQSFGLEALIINARRVSWRVPNHPFPYARYTLSFLWLSLTHVARALAIAFQLGIVQIPTTVTDIGRASYMLLGRVVVSWARILLIPA